MKLSDYSNNMPRKDRLLREWQLVAVAPKTPVVWVKLVKAKAATTAVQATSTQVGCKCFGLQLWE
jgi:hypothetical protein